MTVALDAAHRMPVRLISLPLWRRSQQLAAFSDDSGKTSVPPVTHASDGRQERFASRSVRGITGFMRLLSDENESETGVLNGSESYFSLATTKSGAQSRARLISESGKVQIAFRADSA